MKPILILGLGNLLQTDDGVGCHVAEMLMQQKLPEDVEVMDGGTPGVGLVNLLEGRQRVIIIDAAELQAEPGTIKRFGADQVTLTGSADRFSLHRSGVADALALARTLNITLPDIVFFGVQPERIEWGQTLSESVLVAVEKVVDAILNEMLVKR
jgi:hydrogenase maturation protease